MPHSILHELSTSLGGQNTIDKPEHMHETAKLSTLSCGELGCVIRQQFAAKQAHGDFPTVPRRALCLSAEDGGLGLQIVLQRALDGDTRHDGPFRTLGCC